MNQPPNTDFVAQATGLATTPTVVKILRTSDQVVVFTGIDPITNDPPLSETYVTNLTSPIVLDDYQIVWYDALDVVLFTEQLDVLWSTSGDGAGDILANLDDINAHLPDEVRQATAEDTALLQISAARMIRGYLRRVIDQTTLMSWNAPSATPDLIREIAARLIAAQFYFKNVAGQEALVPQDSFAQKLYDDAITMLNNIITGELILDGVTLATSESESALDFFPKDKTDMAFSKGMEL